MLSVAMTIVLNREAASDHLTGRMFVRTNVSSQQTGIDYCSINAAIGLEDVLYCDQEHFMTHSFVERGMSLRFLGSRGASFLPSRAAHKTQSSVV